MPEKYTIVKNKFGKNTQKWYNKLSKKDNFNIIRGGVNDT